MQSVEDKRTFKTLKKRLFKFFSNLFRYINDIFLKAHKPTVGVEFCSKEIEAPRGSQRAFNLQFWDIGGQERYIYMTHVYYKSADFCLIMFDLNNRESFRACARWKKDLDDKYRLEDGSKCPCLLIGNKVSAFDTPQSSIKIILLI